MTIEQKAKILFVIGCFIAFAGGGQIAFALFGGRPAASIVGVACIVVAMVCCRRNWMLWHRQS